MPFIEHFEKWVKIGNERGHASGSAHNDNVLPGSKATVELSKVQDWAESYGQISGLVITEVRLGEDPPDAKCKVDDVEKSIECMEFVDGDLIGRLKYASKTNPDLRFTSSMGDGFHQAQWNEERFLGKLDLEIGRKTKKYTGGRIFDYLLIYTSENWLFRDDVEKWLVDSGITGNDVFREIFFLMDYHPGQAPSYPVFRVL